MSDNIVQQADQQAVTKPKVATEAKTTKTSKTTPANQTIISKNKKAAANNSAFVINEIKPIKRTPAKMLEMQQAFFESYYNMPSNNSNSANNGGGNGNANAGGSNNGNGDNAERPGNNQNGQNTNGQNGANPNGLGTLGQIAPLFNLLGGGKNAQIGSLISALGDGNMDMNKVISAMAPASGAGGANNLFSSMFNNSQSKKSNATPKEPAKQENGKSIKDLHKI